MLYFSSLSNVSEQVLELAQKLFCASEKKLFQLKASLALPIDSVSA